MYLWKSDAHTTAEVESKKALVNPDGQETPKEQVPKTPLPSRKGVFLYTLVYD